MYLLATTTKYIEGTQYYSKSGNTYTLLSAGTDYTIGANIQGQIYEATEYDRLYIRKYGVSTPYRTLPYYINKSYSLPEHDKTHNDVDLDAYTNLKGKTVRNRQRSNVKTIEFSISLMTGWELHNFMSETKDEWLDVLFFDEEAWDMISKKMYRSATVSYHTYYVDKKDPNNNLYTNVKFAFIEE